MLRFQGAQGAPYPSAPGRDVPDTAAFLAAPPAAFVRPGPRVRHGVLREPGQARTALDSARSATADAVGRARTDLRSARSGAAAAPWIAPATVGIVLVLVFACSVLQVITGGPFVALDWPLREWVYEHRAQGWGEMLLEVQAFLTGERWATVPIVMGTAAVAAYRQGRMRPLYAVMAGLATIAAIGYPVKFGLGRSSPVYGVDVLNFAGGQAFPSGHAANTAFTFTMVVFLLYGTAGLRPDPYRFRRGLRYVAALLAVSGPLVLLMGYHWFSDIPAGWLMGFIALCVSLTVLHWPRAAKGEEAREPRPAPHRTERHAEPPHAARGSRRHRSASRPAVTRRVR